MSRSVHLITLGGTIAMGSDAPDRDARLMFDADALLGLIHPVPGVDRVEASNFRLVPGGHLDLDEIVQLGTQCADLFSEGYDGIVVSQGTDTIEETAFVLDLLWTGPQPIVVTGAMRQAIQLGADGAANLRNAALVAVSTEATGLGALVSLNDEIHAARFARKTHTSQPSAFTSPTVGPIGWIAEGRVRLPLRVTRRVHIDIGDGAPAPVAIVTAALGDDGRVLDRLVSLGYGGVVVAGFGVGHMPVRQVEALTELAREVPVVLASRTGAGETHRSTYGFPGSEKDLLERGLLGAGILDAPKARILLALALGAQWDRDRIAAALERLSS